MEGVLLDVGVGAGGAALGKWISGLRGGFSARGIESIGRSGAEGPLGRLAALGGMLRDAARGKGHFSIGSASRVEAMVMGEAWVGKGFRVASDGKTMIGADGMRQFRPPRFKPRLGKVRANFERKFANQSSRQWQGNAHLDIVD